MLTPFFSKVSACQSGDTEKSPPTRKRRRGATALEYLVCISTILVVVILVVQHLGSVVNGKFVNNAKATQATIQP